MSQPLIKIKPRSPFNKNLKWLWKVTALFIGTHLLVLFAGRWGWSLPEPIGRFFFMDQEYNAPALYNSVLFVWAGYYCVKIGLQGWIQHRLVAITWWMLGVLLFFLGADEFFGIHEQLIIPLRILFDIEGGVFYFAWTIAYIGLVVTVGIVTLPWLVKLDRTLRKRLVIAASIYIFGALILEMVGSWIFSTNGHLHTPLYLNVVTIEESLELIGLTIAVIALARFYSGLNIKQHTIL